MLSLPLLIAACLYDVVVADSQLPVVPLVISESGWTQQPLSGGAYFGDIRAVVSVPPNETEFTAQIFWRRRDPTPAAKGVIVIAALSNASVTVLNADIEPTCGVVTFTPAPQGGLHYIYYLPYYEVSPPQFWEITFSWQGCNDTSGLESNPCVMGRRSLFDRDNSRESVCTSATPAAAAVLRLESRDAFNGFTDMEMLAAPSETSAVVAALTAANVPFGVFCEGADRPIRVFTPPREDGSGGGIPVRWATHPTPTTPAFVSPLTAPGSLLVFQIGLWAYAGTALLNVTASATLPSLPSAEFTFFNLGGVDPAGAAFNVSWGVPAGSVGALWLGLALPDDVVPDSYEGWADVSAAGTPPVRIVLNISVADSPPVLDNGAGNITTLSRLGWLNSQRGIDDSVPGPFVPVAAPSSDPLTLNSLLKTIQVGRGGLPSNVSILAPKIRGGKPVEISRSLLVNPVSFDLFGADGTQLSLTVVQPATVVSITNATVAWFASSTAAGGSVFVNVTGNLDFASYCTFMVTLSVPFGKPAIALSDARLKIPVSPAIAQYVMGMGLRGSNYSDLVWRWSADTPFDKVWMGRADAGIMLMLKGEGSIWNAPNGGIPFVPTSWGGVDALPQNNPNGLNLTNATAVAFSGARTLEPGDPPVTFLFDVALTPSKPVDMTAHYSYRTVQVGYGTPYLPPASVKAMGATIVTLHQGIPGMVNGSLVNPYINYPFTNDVVPLLTNYTAQANELGMATKFYYTVRELSHHAVELFAFKALTDEILVGGDPWNSGSGGGWNQHGGGAWLHQHLITDYAACWQNPLANGEWDQAVCDYGTSRMLNYYLEGLHWSVSHAPFIDGIYYDGINFDRASMIRARRTLDAASGARGLFDLHAGTDSGPLTPRPSLEYMSHLPYMNAVWNGEGYDFTAAPDYYLIEVSAQIHGLSGDTLGCSYPFRGFLYGMTERNSASASALWTFWDTANISLTTMVGWWEDDPMAAVYAPCGGVDLEASACADWNVTIGGYFSSGSPCGSPNGNDGCISADADLSAAQAHCCADPACAGFSWGGPGNGCYKFSQTCYESDAAYDGYWKPGFVPPPPPAAPTLATVYTAYGSHAIVAIATWCIAPLNATVHFDWAGLGLNETSVIVTAPAIASVQAASGPFEVDASGSITVPLEASTGIILLIS